MGWNASIDWTSADTIMNSPRGVVLYDLVRAVYERGLVIGGFIKNDVIAQLSVFEDNQAFIYYYGTPPFSYPGFHWMYWIDKYVRTTFPPYFANQTDQSGDWDGSATAPPVWTLSDLETEIGSVAPELPPTGGAQFAWYITMESDWIWWMHEALNLLVWQYVEISGFSAQDENRRYSITNSTWGNAISDFNDFTPWAYTSVNFIGHSATLFSGTYRILRGRGKITTPDLTPWYSYDAYFRIGAADDGFGGTVTFDDNDYGATENTYVKAASGTGISTPIDVWFGNFGNNNQPEPSSGSGSGWKNTESNAKVHMVYKFNVPMGFDYQ